MDDRLDGGVRGLAHEVECLGTVLKVEVVGDDWLDVDSTPPCIADMKRDPYLEPYEPVNA